MGSNFILLPLPKANQSDLALWTNPFQTACLTFSGSEAWGAGRGQGKGDSLSHTPELPRGGFCPQRPVVLPVPWQALCVHETAVLSKDPQVGDRGPLWPQLETSDTTQAELSVWGPGAAVSIPPVFMRAPAGLVALAAPVRNDPPPGSSSICV